MARQGAEKDSLLQQPKWRKIAFMPGVSDFPSMGATLFVGLTGAALITQGPPEIIFANPQETMAEVQLDTAPETPDLVDAVAWSMPVLLDDDALNVEAALQMAVRSKAGSIPGVAPVTGAPSTMDRIEQTAALSAAAPLNLRPLPGTAPGSANAPEPLDRPNGPEGIPERPSARVPSPELTDSAPALAAAQAGAFNALSRARIAVLPELQRKPSALQPAAARGTPILGPAPRPALVAGDSVFLRSGPSAQTPPLGQFDRDTPVLLHDTRGDWQRVTIGRLSGWMFKKYVQSQTLPVADPPASR